MLSSFLLRYAQEDPSDPSVHHLPYVEQIHLMYHHERSTLYVNFDDVFRWQEELMVAIEEEYYR